MRKLWTTALALTMVLGVVSAAPPASAEIVEGVTTYWGVSGLLTGTTNDDLDSEVWAIEQMGDRVFVGGRFTHVTNEGVLYDQPVIAAFDARTGIWIDSFTPDLNGGAVYALQASSDGTRLFVGGDFDSYGAINVKGLVALDPLTGNVDWSFRARVSGGAQPSVKALDIEGDWLYVAGAFDALKSAGEGPDLSNAGRVSQTTGVVDPNFTPDVVGGAVWGIDASPTTTNVYLAGRFSSVNGAANTVAFAAVDESGASVVTGFQGNNVRRNYMQDVETVNGLVFVGGSEHVLTVFNESDWSIVISHFTNGDNQAFSTYPDENFGGGRSARGDGIWDNIPGNASSVKVADGYTAEICTEEQLGGTCTTLTGFHPTLPAAFDDNIGSAEVVRNEPGPDGRGGDFQDLEVVGDRVYASCHCWGDHFTSPTIHDWSTYETPAGTWNDAQWIHAYSATTGEFIDTFKSGATNSGTGPWAILGADNGCLWFGGGVTGSGDEPADGFVRLCDGDLDTTAPSAVTGLMVASEGLDSVDLSWNAATDNVGVVRYDVIDDNSGGVVASTTELTATISNLEPLIDHSFYVKAIDDESNQGPRSNVVTVNLGAIEGPATCSATNVGPDSTVTWDLVEGAADYRVTRSVDGSAYFWRGVTDQLTFDDTLRSSGIHSFNVQARIAGGDWSDPTSCSPDLDPIDGLVGASPVAACSATNVGLDATVTWDAADNAENYRVLRSVDGGQFYWRGVTSELTLADTLRNSGVHTYSVEARGPDGIWSASTVCDPALDTTPEQASAPAVCSATNVGTDATITWEAADNATEYRVRRSIDGGTVYWRGLSTELELSDVLRGSGSHTYYVGARNGSNGDWSAETTCDPALDPVAGLLAASPPPSCSFTSVGLDATITWEAAENGLDYRVYRSVNDGASFSWRGLTANLTLDDTLRADVATHIYRVQARGENGIWSDPTTCTEA